jgi:hypothetical protein
MILARVLMIVVRVNVPTGTPTRGATTDSRMPSHDLAVRCKPQELTICPLLRGSLFSSCSVRGKKKSNAR